ncbi:MAG: hypothetical protein AAB668_04565 [Patescibacteria group bacterium]|mgnify:CR=1 FL=1
MIFQLLFDAGTKIVATPAPTALPALWPAWVLLGFVLVAMVGIAVQRLISSMRRPDLHGMTREKVLATWAEIEKNADHGLMGAKLAVIEADKLVDGVMKSMLIPGETMGERLKAAQYSYPDIRKVWLAHKLRNQLVHDSTFEITHGQAKRALKDFHAALRTLRIL